VSLASGPALLSGQDGSGGEARPGLKWRTPDAWAEGVLRDPIALLSDHAYLEKKAAANALELLNRWPAGQFSHRWSRALSVVARDEAAHLEMVIQVLARLGGPLERSHSNPYAQALHALVRRGRGNDELVDRLLVAGLIEARSCERFDILSRKSREPALARLYRNLTRSERGHAAVFLDLASTVRPPGAVRRRWEQLAEQEAEIMNAQEPGTGLHSGIRPVDKIL
jgi:tRNA 2-(methylsulfanyl)-N6-isopentenyladenosine37 hydroxylase